MRNTTAGFLLILCALSGCTDDSDPMNVDCDTEFFADTDGDGFGDAAASTTACEVPTGFVTNADDCDDNNAATNPMGAEVCDGVDNDCNSLIDTADPGIDLSTQRAYYRDTDGDGFGDASDSTVSCDQPAGYVTDDSDCDDTRASVNPGATEVCDNLDNDCDQLFDDDDDSLDTSTALVVYADGDHDGFGAGPAIVSCEQPFGFADQDGDCDDGDADSHPGATELCDSRDNDCDGGIDGTPAAPNQCAEFAGSYSGSYSHSAVEKLGATIINQMHCTNGTAALTVNLSQDPPLTGTMSCTYSGGLVAFDNSQSATLTALIDLDGNISGTLVHHYESQLTRTFSFDGAFTNTGAIEIIDTGSMLPNPMSAVPWEVDYTITGD